MMVLCLGSGNQVQVTGYQQVHSPTELAHLLAHSFHFYRDPFQTPETLWFEAILPGLEKSEGLT